jgi:hypothetical protein
MNDAVLPPQIWARADNGDDFKPLKIDGDLVERFNARRGPKLIRPLPDAKRIARRAMEVGYLEAMRARREQPGPIAKDFDNLETLAGNAASALDKLIKHLEPHSAKAADLALPILTAQAGHQEGSAQERHLQAEKDASILWATRETVQRVGKAARGKGRSIRKGRENPGKPEHAAFAKPLGEAWVHLTGRKPGKSEFCAQNPFLRFLSLAWADVFDPEEESDSPERFVGALRKLPVWSAYQLSQLKSQGPYWL